MTPDERLRNVALASELIQRLEAVADTLIDQGHASDEKYVKDALEELLDSVRAMQSDADKVRRYV